MSNIKVGKIPPQGLVVFTSAPRTGIQTSSDFINDGYQGIYLFVDITDNPGGTQNIRIVTQVKDPFLSKYVDLFESPTIRLIETHLIKICPGAIEDNMCSSQPLSRIWRVQVRPSGSGSFTYSISANMIM